MRGMHMEGGQDLQQALQTLQKNYAEQPILVTDFEQNLEECS